MSPSAPRNARRVACALALIAGFSSQSSAQVREWDDYCTTGSLQMCMSIGVTLTLIPNPGQFFPNLTEVTVSLQNLEGSLGSPQPWGLEGLSLQGLAYIGPQGFFPNLFPLTPTFEESAQDHGVPAFMLPGLWDEGVSNLPPAAAFGAFNRDDQQGDGAWPIGGCTPLAPDSFGMFDFNVGYFSTCGDAAIQYSFLMPEVEFTDATTVHVTGYLSATTQTFTCTFGTDCVQVTPEPSTVTLVAIGLIGLAAFERKRRRGWRPLPER